MRFVRLKCYVNDPALDSYVLDMCFPTGLLAWGTKYIQDCIPPWGLNPAIFKVRSHQGSTATSCNTCSNKNYYKCLIIPIIICISINTRITKNILECFNQIYQ